MTFYENVYMLLGAIILEIFGTCLTKFLLMKDLAGTHLVMPIFLLCSYYCLSKAIRTIPISIAYAAWEGLGLILTTMLLAASSMNICRWQKSSLLF